MKVFLPEPSGPASIFISEHIFGYLVRAKSGGGRRLGSQQPIFYDWPDFFGNAESVTDARF